MIKSVNTFLVVCVINIFTSTSLFAQKDPTWDDTSKNNWDSAFQKVEIPSSVDNKIQKAYLYSSKSKTPKPLIISLHTWSADYTQKDPLTKEILARDWNYIHPDFRGANKTAESMGSQLVISDIEDAIAFALKNTNSDPNEVHIIGVSGGGFATLAAYMNVQYPVKTFSAWAPISDLETWYWESVGRKQKYADDIFKALSTDSVFNSKEAIKRSPLLQKFPQELRKNAKLYIYEGIHDGYTGSVPITHSINMYNRLVGEIKYGLTNLDEISSKTAKDSDLVPEKEIINLITKRFNPDYKKEEKLFDRNIYLSRKFNNIQLTIFEGGHEQIPQALGLIPHKATTSLKHTILTLGDSNGANKDGWVDQLKKRMPESFIYNISKGGRTIGFDNLGKKDLNALTNIDDYLNEAQQKIGNKKYDYIIVCLGTNDTKKVFADNQNEVATNFDKLLNKIKSHSIVKKSKTKFLFVTPPPIRTNNILDKYSGSNERLQALLPQLKTVAAQYDFEVIDIYNPLLGILDYYAQDGIHMAGSGQEIIASQIIEFIGN
ncbi:G-D-S-L family lipolytic protein [Flavobacterium alvei]|uniref:G-D-S-L family lipolytic protein n=1 Tax=Flavobacterium alvei TaxID=2080416 RepID=A0A2S5AF29_9FLAO|nr:GDSL-type esterase/lipase family protein [Flavobacterium alvei]POY41181.1 G-D-S-L family lipolytic protein [Flavobacterium alvei]